MATYLLGQYWIAKFGVGLESCLSSDFFLVEGGVQFVVQSISVRIKVVKPGSGIASF